MKTEYPQPHVRILSLLKERLAQGALSPPIYGTVRGEGEASSFVIRQTSDIAVQTNGNGRGIVRVPDARGGTVILGEGQEYQLKFSRDGKGRAIFLTNLNQ